MTMKKPRAPHHATFASGDAAADGAAACGPVAVLGLGNMGSAVARRLLDMGFDVMVWNRSPGAARQFPAACVAPTAADAVTPGGIALTVLADDAAVTDVIVRMGVADRLGAGGLHIGLSTIGTGTAARLAAHAQAAGCAMVSAPVMGRPEKALDGALAIMTSGPADATRRAQPLLRALAVDVANFGDAPEAAIAAKLAMNFLGAAAIEAIGEAGSFVERHGVDLRTFMTFMSDSVFDSYNYRLYGSRIAANRYDPAGFRIGLGRKDIDLVLAAAGERDVPMPFAGIVRDRLLAMIATGRGDLDWTAMALGAREAAGLPSPAMPNTTGPDPQPAPLSAEGD